MSDPLVQLQHEKQPSMYYYDIFGNSHSGENSKMQQYDLSDDRFPMNFPSWMFAQGKTWKQNSNEIKPNQSAIPGLLPSEFSMKYSTPSPSNML